MPAETDQATLDDVAPAVKPLSTELSKGKRLVITLMALFTAIHIFASFLWIAPPSGLRELFPGNSLQSYMIPMFGQSWSVFAPNPINGDYKLEIRATVREGGESVQTKWIDATAADLTMHMRQIFPARAGMTSTDVASRFKGAWDALNDDQKAVVELGYYKGDDWRERMEEALRAYGNTGAVDRYMTMERIALAYSTQVAYALWGDNVEHVQFIASRQNVIPYAQRNDPNAVRPAVQPAPLGWRGTIELEGQSRENFAKIFLRGFEKSGQVL